MVTKIVDASAVAAVLFVEPNADQIAPQLTGFRLRAPTIFGYEIANICATKLRRFPEVARNARPV